MSLFSYDPTAAPADRARERLLDHLTYMHEGLRWRADAMRSAANGLDEFRELLEAEIERIAVVLARQSLQDEPEEGDQFGAEDHYERA